MIGITGIPEDAEWKDHGSFKSTSYTVDAKAFELKIKPTELRLGNWLISYAIWDTGTKTYFSPFQVDLKFLETLSGPMAPLVTVDPIPITEEWLIKLGFRYDEMTYSNECLLLSKGDFGFDVWTNGLSGGITTQCVFVHQLQNLFFALKGKELQITPP